MISYQQDRVVTVCRNELPSLVDKIVDKDGKIPSVKQVSDIQESLHVVYFNSSTGLGFRVNGVQFEKRIYSSPLIFSLNCTSQQ